MVLRGDADWLTDRRHGNIAQVDSESISSFHSIPPPALQCRARDRASSKHSLTLLVCPIFCRPPMIAHACPRLIMASQARMSKATPPPTYYCLSPFHFSSQSNRSCGNSQNTALLAIATCMCRRRSFPLHLLFRTDDVHACRCNSWKKQNIGLAIFKTFGNQV